MPFGDCWEPSIVDRGDKEGGLRGGSWLSKLPDDFWEKSEGVGRARCSSGGSIGVRGVKNAEETVLADEPDDLFVDSDVNNGGGWAWAWPVRCACWAEPVRLSFSGPGPG